MHPLFPKSRYIEPRPKRRRSRAVYGYFVNIHLDASLLFAAKV